MDGGKKMQNREDEIKPLARAIDPQSRIYDDVKEAQISSAKHEERLKILEKIDLSRLQEKVERLDRDVSDLLKFKDNFLIKLVYGAWVVAVAIISFFIATALKYVEPINKLLELLDKLTVKT